MWGLNTEKLNKEFGEKYKSAFIKKTKELIDKNFLKKTEENYILTEKGMLISDNIISSILIVE
jgi:coproporphyrinogen III oxidase-like Fe-S oxidoreductase